MLIAEFAPERIRDICWVGSMRRAREGGNRGGDGWCSVELEPSRRGERDATAHEPSHRQQRVARIAKAPEPSPRFDSACLHIDPPK